MYDYDFDYSLFEHKKSDTVKWVLTLVAFLIVGVMLAGILCGWFEKEEEIPQEEQQEQTYNGAPVTDENGEVIDGTKSHLLPKAMAFRSAALLDGADAPYTSVTLTATVEPDTASDKTVDWSVRFMNGEILTLLSKHYSDPLGSFSINMTGEYTSFDKSVEMIYTPGTVKISVENITLSQSGLVV